MQFVIIVKDKFKSIVQTVIILYYYRDVIRYNDNQSHIYLSEWRCLQFIMSVSTLTLITFQIKLRVISNSK